MTLYLLQAQAQGGSGMSMILMMVALFAIMYFFMIRPQNKKQKEIEKFRSALSVGQDVVTIGGITAESWVPSTGGVLETE